MYLPILCDEEIPFTDLCCSDYWLLPDVESIAFHKENKTTVVRWADGTKTVVRCGEGETFSEYSAFVAAVAKKIFGSTSAVKKLIEEFDLARVKAREEAERRAERERQDDAARRNRRRRVRRMARELQEYAEALSLAQNGQIPEGEEGENG